MQRYVENPIANRILSSDFVQGDSVLVTVDEASNRLLFKKAGALIGEVATA
jgi:ATP-dependent Clp protease ATP-binding subunit ClpA